MRLGPFQLLFFFSAQCSFDNMEEIHQLCRFALTLKTVSEEIKPQTVEKNKCVSCNYYVILFLGGGGLFSFTLDKFGHIEQRWSQVDCI